MKKIDSTHQLISRLASKGDPSAFYTLFSEQLKNSFIILRKEGNTSLEACQVIFPLCTQLYRSFIGRDIEDTDDWFSSHWELKHYDEPYDNLKNAEEFENRLQLYLQKEYSSFISQHKKRGKNSLLLKSSKLRTAVLTILGIVFVSVIINFSLLFSGTSVGLSISRLEKNMQFTLPVSFFSGTQKNPELPETEQAEADDPDSDLSAHDEELDADLESAAYPEDE